MNKYFSLIILLSSLLSFSNNSKKIIVALSLNDCANYSVVLYQIYEELKHPEITFILKSHLEADSLLVNNRTGIYEFEKSKVIYSDTLHKKYSNSIISTIHITKNDESIYSSPLLKVEMSEFLKYFREENNYCYKNLKNEVKQIQYDNSLLSFSTELYRWTYYDPNNEIEIIADTNWVKEIYNLYYKNIEKSKAYFEQYEYVLKSYPNIYPIIRRGKKINANELLFIVNVKFFEKEDNKLDNTIINKDFFVHYNIQENKIEKIRFINIEDSSIAEKYFINSHSFHIYNDNYIIPIIDHGDTTEESNYLTIFEVNPNDSNEIILKNVIQDKIPNNYIKYEIYYNLHDYRFDKSLALLSYGEYIYDFEKNKKYKIPFSQDEFDKLDNIVSILMSGNQSTAYYIYDISNQQNSILLLYKDSDKNVKLMEINKANETVMNDEVLLTPNHSNYNIAGGTYIFDESGDVIYLNKDNCITKLHSYSEN